MKKLFKIIGILLAVLLVAVAALLGWLTLTEYLPAATEEVTVQGTQEPAVFSGNSLTVLSMNIGYAALGEESDFFMDGGKGVHPDSADIITKNLKGIRTILQEHPADVTFLQEVDTDSKRSYYTDECALLRQDAEASAFALNYRCNYVPYPLPTIGKVNSGLLTMSRYRIGSARRISLPCPFSWPLRVANLKRCLLVSYLPIANTAKQLVLVNLHLEAYDDGEGKKAQTEQLMELLLDEYAKGNYVIAGGDFNQLFPDTEALYPNTHSELWTPGLLEPLGGDWHYGFDASAPTCRLLNRPYTDAADPQYYVIDGFILSPNVAISSVQTLSEDFAYSDHNPVLLHVELLG